MPGMRAHWLFEYSTACAFAMDSGDISIRKNTVIGFLTEPGAKLSNRRTAS